LEAKRQEGADFGEERVEEVEQKKRGSARQWDADDWDQGNSQCAAMIGLHPQMKVIDRYAVPYPRYGLPHTGQPAVTKPVIVENRENYLSKGMYCLAIMKDLDPEHEPVPIVLFRIEKVMRMDRVQGWNGVWLRISWWRKTGDPLVSKYGKVLGTTMDNVPLLVKATDTTNWEEPLLLHWALDKKNMLKKDSRFTAAVLKLVANDTRLQQLPAQVQKKIADLLKTHLGEAGGQQPPKKKQKGQKGKRAQK